MKKTLLSILIWALAIGSCFASGGMKPMGGGFLVAGGADVTAPEFSSATINATAATVTLTEDVVITGLDDGDFVMTGSTTGASNLTSCSEDAGVISCTAADTFVNGETVTLAYSGGADEVEDTAGNDLDTFSGESVTNNTPGSESYTYTQDFEGTGTPASWFTSGTVDFDEETTVLESSESLEVDSSSGNSYAVYQTSAQTEIWGKFRFRTDHVPDGAAVRWRFYSETQTILANISMNGTGALVATASGGTSDTMTANVGSNSTVYIWYHYTVGSGTDTELEVWWSTSDSHPGNSSADYYAIVSDGTSTTSPYYVGAFSENVGSTNGSSFYDYCQFEYTTQPW
jgi:hypothetical protein